MCCLSVFFFSLFLFFHFMIEFKENLSSSLQSQMGRAGWGGVEGEGPGMSASTPLPPFGGLERESQPNETQEHKSSIGSRRRSEGPPGASGGDGDVLHIQSIGVFLVGVLVGPQARRDALGLLLGLQPQDQVLDLVSLPLHPLLRKPVR